MIAGTYMEEMLKRRRARQLAEAEERGLEQGREQGVEQGLEKGVTKGRADLSAEIREWNARRLEAEAKGEPFDEPPPWLNG